MTATAFSDWLKQQMLHHSIGVTELGRRAGVSHVTISQVAAGKYQPSGELCVGLAQALRLPPETVLREGGYLPPLPDAAAQATVQRIGELLLGLAGTARGQERLAMLETMIEALYAAEYP